MKTPPATAEKQDGTLKTTRVSLLVCISRKMTAKKVRTDTLAGVLSPINCCEDEHREGSHRGAPCRVYAAPQGLLIAVPHGCVGTHPPAVGAFRGSNVAPLSKVNANMGNGHKNL